MKYRIKMLALAAVLCGALPLAPTMGQVTKGGFQLPSGSWTLTHHSYSRPGYEAMPIVVMGVKGDATKGLAITVVGLKNQTAKPVDTYKLTWYLYETANPNRILQKGETPFIYPGRLAANEQQAVDIPVVSFINICKPLVKDGSLKGNFAIDVAVTEVRFEDGTTRAWLCVELRRVGLSATAGDRRRDQVAATLESSAPSCRQLSGAASRLRCCSAPRDR